MAANPRVTKAELEKAFRKAWRERDTAETVRLIFELHLIAVRRGYIEAQKRHEKKRDAERS